ncbi:MAG: hypothetical protein C5B55_05995 [Blastocatellia bacterium]|nr:MAG: hypothetical protein C5B55_05995 [Blastocatellia bacterium]
MKELRQVPVKRLLTLLITIVALAGQARAQVPKRYDVVGPVKTFRQETAKLNEVNGATVEGIVSCVENLDVDDDESVFISWRCLKKRSKHERR